MANKSQLRIYKLKILLSGIRPPVWRRVQVRSDVTLTGLHEIIQIVMPWTNSHLFKFKIGGIDYGQTELDSNYCELGFENSSVALGRVVRGKTKFLYEYDFGDSWEHEISVEDILPAIGSEQLAVCLGGKRACPPEDCGGPGGYAGMLEILQDKSHPEHEERVGWLGDDFDPERFDLDETNATLTVAFSKLSARGAGHK
jgi:hypothetical protein